MAQQTINIGSAPNDGTGDTIRVGGDKINDNFTEIYGWLDTDGTLAANSDSKVATQKAVKTYVASAVTGLLDLKGSTDCSANPNYPSASKGDTYIVSVAGKIGGASGTVVEVGDVYIATADNAGGTQASVGASWDVIQGNILSGAGVTFATASDINTGTDTAKVLNSDALAGSNVGIRYLIVGLNGSTALTTSDKAYVRVPSALNGMNLVTVSGSVGTGAAGSSSSGTPTFTVKNVTDSNQMLSTSLTIDATEYSSATATTAAVIDTSKDDVVTDDLIEVACTTAGTGTTFATVTLGFQLP